MQANGSKQNNKGMTLVELLVAITILALIVVPLLHAFASSARVSLNTRRKLRVTTAAQDIMEGLKAESIDSLAYSFNYPDGAAANDFANFRVVRANLIDKATDSSKVYELRCSGVDDDPTSATYRQVTVDSNISAGTNADITGFATMTDAQKDALIAADKVPSAMLSADGLSHDFYEKSDHKYYFAIQDMNIEDEKGADAPLYIVDALIEVDGDDYVEHTPGAAGEKKQNSYASELGAYWKDKKYALLNSLGIADFTETNEKKTAFAIQNEDDILKVVQEFNSNYHPATDVKPEDICREIVIETSVDHANSCRVTAPDGSPIPITKVTCKISYYTDPNKFCLASTDPGYVAGVKTPYMRTVEYTPQIFSNENTGYDLDNIFLFYYPNYDSWKDDTITYVSTEPGGNGLYIVKQEPKDNGSLANDEQHYKCDVRILEGTGAKAEISPSNGVVTTTSGAFNRTDDKSVKIYTNLDENMYAYYIGSFPDFPQGRYHYNSTAANLTRNKADPDASKIYELGGKPEAADRMFDVTIDIYEQGTLSGVLSGGTITNDKVLFTLKGSMK